jgi:hypothetical protein
MVNWLDKKIRFYETRCSSLSWWRKHIFGSLLNQLKQALHHYSMLLQDPLWKLIFRLRLGLQRGSFLWGFSTIVFYFSSPQCYMSHPFRFSWYDHPNSIQFNSIQFNSVLFYLCAESTAVMPITDTAQCTCK